jgi:hypothetical protein
LDPQAIVIAQESPIILSQRQLPARQLKRIGASVALGAVALLAEAGIRYLRQRSQDWSNHSAALPASRKKSLPVSSKTQIEEQRAGGKRVVTVFSERVVEERRWGRPVRRIVDRLAWRSEETLDP